MKRNNILIGPSARKVYSSLACILVGLFIGLVIMIALSPDGALFDFGMMMSGGIRFYNLEGVGNIIATMAPLLCCGVGIVFAYKTGIFNIGAAGQYILGAFGAITFAAHFKCHWTVCILMAILLGAFWGIIPALLKAFFKVNEIISGIMLNWTGLFFVNYSLQTYLDDIVDVTDSYQTFKFWVEPSPFWDNPCYNPSAKLPNMGLDMLGETFSVAIIIAVAVAILAFIILEKTTFGYQLKASGYNRHATKYAGINSKKNAIFTMAISGAMVGLGAALYYLCGLESWAARISSTLPQVPWNGIVVAFIAQLSPVGSIGVAGLLALLTIGSTAMSQSTYPKEVSDLIISIIVYLSGLTAITMRFIPWIKEKKRKKNHQELVEKPLSVNVSKGGK